ncbi:MAG: hypothetical protein N3D11_13855 [Candidatus Sumerlaeia bacterium]|nr:hypothetical protein [Candidatus Sumerlaeia bacterium]
MKRRAFLMTPALGAAAASSAGRSSAHAAKDESAARVNPKATRMLIVRGEIIGTNGWDVDEVDCSVGAVIKPPQGRLDEFLRRRLEYGNHLQWVYGDYVEPLRQTADLLGLEAEVIA